MGIATQYEGGLKFDGDQMYITTSSGTTLLTLGNTGNATFAGTIAATNFSGSSSGTNTGDQTLPTDFVSAASGGTFSAGITISNTFPFLDFVDTNSFTDTGDRFRVRAGANQGLIQWYDASAGSAQTIMSLDPNGDVDIVGDLTADNFSGSSSGTNTGDQTLPTLSSLGGASSVYLTNTGGAKIEIQNSQDGGASKGIYMWSSSDPNWGIYMAQAGDSKALNDGTASAGIDGATAHAIRFRVNDNAEQAGFIWENNSNETLMQLNGGSEKLYTKNAIYPSNQTTNYVDSTRIANWQTAYGWGDHGLSAQDKTDIAALSGTNTGDQNFSTLGAATRTNYTLKFQPPTSSYAGFQFLDTSGNGAGYFLVRGTSDNGVYTAEGITLVADAGWLTLAQRTASNKGIRFMTGATAADRMTIANDGDININNSLTVGADLGVNGAIKDTLYKHTGSANWQTKKYVRSVGITGGEIADSWVQLSRVVISSTYEKVTIKFTINGYDDVSSGVEAIDVRYENGASSQENHQCAWYSTDDHANLFKAVRSIRSASNGLSNTYDVYVQMAGDWRDNFTVVAESWTTHGDNASIAYVTANGSATEPSAGDSDVNNSERRWYTENTYMYLGGSNRVYTTGDFATSDFTYSAGTLLDLSSNTFNVDLTELTNNTASFAPTQDHFVILDNGVQGKKLGSSIFGSAAYEASSAFATASHSHAGTYALEYENLAQASGAEHDMHQWRKVHASYSNNSGNLDYLVIQTEVPQDNYSMGGFTLVYQDNYNTSGEGGEIKIYGYWNPEVNGGFQAFRYECSNPYHTPTIEVCRNSSSGNTAFFISGEGGNYAQLIAKDLWFGYTASSATAQWGNGWVISEASDKTGYTNFDTLDRNDFAAITTNGSTPSLTGGVSAAEVRTLIGAGTSSSDTTYTAGTGLTLTNTTFSVTANTYAAASHNHNSLYYTEDEIRLALARTNGWEADYGSTTSSNIKWNLTEEALELKNDTDTSIGAVYKAVWMEAGETKRWTVMIRGSQTTTDGMYVRLYQHDGNLPDGKTHVTHTAAGTFTQEDDRGDTGWYENGAISDSWTNFEREYKAPAAGYVSLVVLNWTGNGTESLFIKNPDIQTVYATVEAGSIGISELAVSDGSDGQVLTTNGSGTLSFATVSSGSADTNYYLDGITRTDNTNTLVFSVNGATNQSYTFGANAFNSTTIPAAEQYTAHEDTSTLNGTYGSTANGTKIDEITVDANGHITAITTGATGNMTGFFVEDGDGTEVQINNANEWKFVEGTGISINWTDTSAGSDTDPYDLTIACTIDSPGEVGLANLSSSGNALAGTFTATGDLIAYSDARVKENVETIPNALEKVTALRGVNFNKIGEEKRSTGVIAQEVAEVIPEVVHESEDGMLGVAYGNITGLLIEAIKEQQKQIDELKAKLDGSTK